MIMTTVPINTFQDIINAMTRDPQLGEALRSHVLDAEIRDTPRRIAELTETVGRLADVVQATAYRIDRLEATVAQLAIDQAELKATVAQLAIDQVELKATVAQLAIDQAELKATVAQLAIDQAELKATVAQLATGQVELKTAVAELKATVAQLAATVERLSRGYASMSGKIDNINGSRYEQQTAHLAPRYARRLFGFQPAAITHRSWQHGDLLVDATTSDRITDRDAGSLLNADVVVSGALPDGAPAHIVGEISLTIAETDIHRADARARILDTALDHSARVIPVAFGAVTSDEATVAANRLGVHIVTVPDYNADIDADADAADADAP